MADLEINLDTEVNELKKRIKELRKLYSNPQGPTPDEQSEQRIQLIFLMTEINSRITILELIELHRNAEKVIVTSPTQVEIDNLNTALKKLHEIIKREDTFVQTIQTVTGILEAADTINSAARSGKAAS